MKNNFFFKFLPKQPVASFSFQNPTLSPPRSPVSIIPKEARRKDRGGMSLSAKEPSSPKVSCMGQVQCKKKKKKAQKPKGVQQIEIHKSESVLGPEKKEEKVLVWMISKGTKQSGKGFVGEEKASSATVEAPSLGMMKKFASGRGTLCDVDFELAER